MSKRDFSQYYDIFERVTVYHVTLEPSEQHLYSFEVQPARWKRLFGFVGKEYPELSISRNMQGHFTDKRIIIEHLEKSELEKKIESAFRKLPSPVVTFGLESVFGKIGQFLGETYVASSEAENAVTSDYAISIPYRNITGIEYVDNACHPIWKADLNLRTPLFAPYPTNYKDKDVYYTEVFYNLCRDMVSRYS